MFSLPRSFAVGIVIAILALPVVAQQTSSAVLSDSQSSQSQTQARPTLTSVSARNSVQTFRGTIRRDMDGYILRDSTGVTYGLDDQTRIRAFEGQNVKLKGKLNASTGSIRVVSIESSY
jgi:hypothetical protein